MYFVFLYFIISIFIFSRSHQLNIHTHLTIVTNSGPVRGQLTRTVIENRSYYSFKGIPYGEPPSYNHRFLPPIPKRKWTHTKDCFEFGYICLQFNPVNKTQIVGNEDCLFLNVYTPAPIDLTNPKPVMVYIHGGGFAFGSGNDDLQGPDLLINEDVILVTMNYRIGVLGFMSLGTPKYSGNQGLKDQQLALKWIRTNIEQFGGDSNKITIFGQSAGSASSHFHVIAPGSKGLFQQTIEMSTTFDVWSIFEKGNHLQDMYELTYQLKYNANNYKDLIRFLKSIDPRVLVQAFPIIQFYPDQTPIKIESKWLPVVENSAALQPFMQFTPSQMLLLDMLDMDVNVMMGYTTAESLFLSTPDTLHPDLLNSFNYNFAIELPSIHFNRDYNSSDYTAIAAKIRQFYFPLGVDVNANYQTLQAFVQLMSHVYQQYPIDQMARLMAKKSNGSVHFYRFGLVTRLNYYKNLLGAQNQFGASHADDLCYIFRCKLIDDVYETIRIGTAEYEQIKMMTGLYTNFARYSNPVPGRLRSVQSDRLHFVDITANGLMIDTDPLDEVIDFWTKLLNEHPLSMDRDVDRYVDSVIKTMMTK